MKRFFSVFLLSMVLAVLVNAQQTRIYGAIILDPENNTKETGDVLLRDGRIVSNLQSDGPSPIILVNPVGDPRVMNRKFEQVPSVVSSGDGKQIFAAWYSGGAAPGPGNYVTVSVSLDNGKTWLNDQLVVMPKDPASRFFDPGLWRDKFGEVHLTYGSSKSGLFDGVGGVNMLDIRWVDGKLTHSDPIVLTSGVMSNKPVYVSGKDQQLFSVYIDKPAAPASNLPAYGAFILEHPYGKGRQIRTLSAYGTVVVPDDIKIHDEPQIVQTSSKGDFLCLVRTTKGVYFSRSNDFGKTWSAIEPFTAAGPTTSSRLFIGRLKSGNLLLIMNASTVRNNMTAFLSKDGGKTWPSKLLLDSRENVSYPDADQDQDGNINVVFDRDRTGAKDILFFRFTEKDITNGSETAVLKTRINKP